MANNFDALLTNAHRQAHDNPHPDDVEDAQKLLKESKEKRAKLDKPSVSHFLKNLAEARTKVLASYHLMPDHEKSLGRVAGGAFNLLDSFTNSITRPYHAEGDPRGVDATREREII